MNLNSSIKLSAGHLVDLRLDLAIAIAIMEAEPIRVDQNAIVLGISTDTRTLETGDLFFALAGESFDGHKFVAKAISSGAVAAVVNETWFNNSSNNENAQGTFLVVKDVLNAYQNLATWWRSQCKLPVIAITGSAGKTTTKEIISQLLSFYGRVHKSAANHNNDIGVAQTLLRIDPQHHDFVVVEMGMRGKGEIARLSQVAAPDVAVITNIGTAHIGRLGSQQAIAEAKCELLAYLPTSSVAVLNGEDQLLLKTATQVWQGKAITYGLNGGDVKGNLTTDATIQVEGRSWKLPLSGRHNAMNFLAGLGVIKSLGLDWQKISTNIGNLDLPAGRAKIYSLQDHVTILDETYNCSPEAAIAALHLLAQIPTQGRRWAVLGTMKELGAMSASLHAQVGQTAKDLKIDCLLVLSDGESDEILTGVGKDFKYVGKCGDRSELVKILLNQVQTGDSILFKASNSVGMNVVVQEFQAAWENPSH
ncbi:UDP-N-acetylmuramoyl-tripeptide--D-alanyl-D-alanine ligase [Synechococcus sp. PCC 7502]|uniref:UDP-N-acetylmuramoyl-tripeptide--D-alanyl-D- alanine ligase n=1 Tax=Synechococcus sp. PCC 7502 TaxID=1173263 RepID=UPI003526D852